MILCARSGLLVAAALALSAMAALAESPGPQGPAAGPYRKQEWRIPVPDADGVTPRLLEALLYRPAGEAKRPLVVMSHGSPRRRPRRDAPGLGRARGRVLRG